MPPRLPFAMMFLITLTLLGLPAARGDELRPCETCRDATCSFLTDLPPCPDQPKPKKERPRRQRSNDAASPAPPAAPPPQVETTDAAGAGGGPSGDAAPPEGTTGTPSAPSPSTTQPAAGDDVRPSAASAAARPLRRAALGLGIPGLLLIAGGAVLLGLDRRFGQDCLEPGDLRTCQRLYSTTAPGAALLATGGAALIGAVVLFAVDARRAQRPRSVALRLLWPGSRLHALAATP